MINWTIQVQTPILTQGMSFQVKYRKLPTLNWMSLSPNPTTNEFTITNLEPGEYEAEVRTICTNGNMSSPVTYTNAINADCVLSVWSDWTDCVGGLQTRTRTIITSPSGNGNPCGALSEIKNCGVVNPNIYITDVVSGELDEGYTNYKLHVENEPFIGYANTVATKSIRLKLGDANFSPFGNNITFLPSNPTGDKFSSEAVNIPIGVYDCTIHLDGIAISYLDSGTLDGAISYSLTTDYYDGICQAEAHLIF